MKKANTLLSIKTNTITSLELVNQINIFRKEIEGKKDIAHKTILGIIRDEFEQEISGQEFLPSDYIDSNGIKRPMFNLTYSQAKQVLARESKQVRKAMIKRLEFFESQTLKPKELSKMEILRLALESEQERIKLESELEKAKPAIEFTKSVQNSINSITIQEFAKICGTGQKRMFFWLREEGFLMSKNQPYQKFLDNGCFKFIEKSYLKNGENMTYFQTLITGKGQISLQKLWPETPVKLLEINS